MRALKAKRSGLARQPAAGRWLLSIAASLLLACSTGTADEPSGAAKPPRARDEHVAQSAALPKVAFLGDSITAGLHLPARDAFPAVVQRTLEREQLPFELLNAGVSGDTTAGGLSRVDWILKQGPAVVVIELGANDGMRGLALEPVERNLRAIIERVRDKGARPLLLGIRLPPSYGQDYAERFDAIYPRVAADLGVSFVPFFMQGVAGVPDRNLPDGIHPTKEGHELIAQPVAAALKKELAAI